MSSGPVSQACNLMCFMDSEFVHAQNMERSSLDDYLVYTHSLFLVFAGPMEPTNQTALWK